MSLRNILKLTSACLLGSFVIVGCAVDADGDPDVVTTPGPSSTTVIDRDTPSSPTIVTPPAGGGETKTDVNIDTGGGVPATSTTTTTGG
jgi:hypothetical protein